MAVAWSAVPWTLTHLHFWNDVFVYLFLCRWGSLPFPDGQIEKGNLGGGNCWSSIQRWKVVLNKVDYHDNDARVGKKTQEVKALTQHINSVDTEIHHGRWKELELAFLELTEKGIGHVHSGNRNPQGTTSAARSWLYSNPLTGPKKTKKKSMLLNQVVV